MTTPQRPSSLADSTPLPPRMERSHWWWRYARALDTLNADAYVAVFTEDGSFESGSNASKGHAALRTMIDGVKKNPDRTRSKQRTAVATNVSYDH